MPLPIFSESVRPKRFDAVAVVFDMQGFTHFCTLPQVDSRIPEFINRTFGLVASCVSPGDNRAAEEPSFAMGRTPLLHGKFLGDGALLLWALPKKNEDRRRFYLRLLNRLYIAVKSFPEEVEACRDDFGFRDLPEAIRFGVAAGEIIELAAEGHPTEYVGFPINLAARLEGYCKELGFLASARIGIPAEELEEEGFVKVTAPGLKGFSSEILIADRDDLRDLPRRVREKLFNEM